jgi:hypothetical protein
MTHELKLPLAYRPHQYDDWGVLRDADGNLFTQISWPRFGEEVYAEHRKNGTDPYEQAAKMVMNAVNARPPQDAGVDVPEWLKVIERLFMEDVVTLQFKENCQPYHMAVVYEIAEEIKEARKAWKP